MQKLSKLIGLATLACALAACQTTPRRDTFDKISAEMGDAAAKSTAASPPDAVTNALLPPTTQLASALPKARTVLEERFTVAFNGVGAQQFFNAIAQGTRYTMLVHPEVSGTITANLKEVTLFEALDAVKELYGYDYKVEGTRIYIRPLTMQTKMFKVNYLTSARRGASNLRVTSTTVSDANQNNNGNNQNNNQNNQNNNSNNNGGNNNGNDGNGNGNQQTSRAAAIVQTTSDSDFWRELRLSLEAIVGTKDGRSVVVSPQSGVILVRGMPDELRAVAQYLQATQLAVERQVILEAKILEVELSSSSQNGVNWARFASVQTGHGNASSIGFLQPGAGLAPLPPSGIGSSISNGGSLSGTTGFNMANSAAAAGGLLGLAFQTSNFAALISFLESQGTVHVLSSPRIATLNNQKAVLKVGTDEFFVTGVSTTVTTNATGNGTASPNVTLTPFFSGVVLDVTPQIDDDGHVILHVHPSVSQVSTVNKGVNLGSAGSLNLPLATSVTSEMDSMVRGRNGEVVAIGGLMRQSGTNNRSSVPGTGSLPVLGALFGNKEEVQQKRELVVLIKPTIVDGAESWSNDLMDANRRIKEFDPANATKGRR
ncbi:pilus (MSHA type) biogenesis protein MshL [Massilia endophytica]|uniref:pilus (MSHA type) biogenesis protein MshL n=1 Tax=Massilia endophytica TaxID=2899220 RepID=UPI001E2AA92E|nr:pilus (MSHA type) biogenesis protein MshL [Massilia endophytica]UGQ48379.1 pilus (MSHA type) biogenesis protein MshL [Massilia endophytica]